MNVVRGDKERQSVPVRGLVCAASCFSVVLCFAEEVMLAEENKNAGPSALDGKPAEISQPPLVSFCIVVLFLTLLSILPPPSL